MWQGKQTIKQGGQKKHGAQSSARVGRMRYNILVVLTIREDGVEAVSIERFFQFRK